MNINIKENIGNNRNKNVDIIINKINLMLIIKFKHN